MKIDTPEYYNYMADLRIQFATAAMTSILTGYSTDKPVYVAQQAFKHADAMLAELKASSEKPNT